jgi:DNA invertase Pin-like site-specific DNA recombinase
MTRVALLARVSTDEQAEGDRLSLPAQLRVMRERCEREGWDVVAEFTAPGESAYTDNLEKRPTLLKAIRAAEAGSFDVLMVHESSRLARNAFLALEVRRRLERAGVALIDATGRIEARTAESGMFFTLSAGMNEYWSEKMGEHIRKAKRQLVVEGLHVGDPPFGYRRVGPRQPLAVVPEEAKAVREGFRDYVAGASYTEILRRWNAQGLRPRSKQGHTQFTVPAMQSIFENDFYAGFIRHKGERLQGAHEALISEDLWLAAQSRVNRRESRSRNKRMLSGVATCVACDGPMWLTSHGRRGKPTYYYREPSRERGRSCANAVTMWRAEEVERRVSEALRGLTRDEAWLRRVASLARRLPEVDNSAREKLLAERRRVSNAYMAEAIEEAEWRQRLAGIDEQLSRLPSPVPGGVVFAGEQLVNFGQLWDIFTTDEQREVCRTVFEQVAVDTRGHEVWFRPWPEFAPYLEARREVVWLLGPPGGGVSKRTTHPWLYSAAELGVAA